MEKGENFAQINQVLNFANENLLYILVSFPFSYHFKMQGQRGQ